MVSMVRKPVGLRGRSLTRASFNADATNTTRARRQALVERIKREPGIKLMFIESVCTDPATIAANIAVKVASGDPDYDGQEPSQAEQDFKRRISHYERSYEPLDEQLDKEVTYCKMVNVGKQVSTSGVWAAHLPCLLVTHDLT